jgi:2-oxoglutarate ferredoxin oxidoreductase subunit alpha
LGETAEKFLVFEMSMGQMVEDVRLALNGKAEVELYGRPGGVVITPMELSRILARRYNAMKHEA